MDFINKNRLYIGITAVGSLIGAAIFLAFKYGSTITKPASIGSRDQQLDVLVEEPDTLANRVRREKLEMNGNYPTPEQLAVLADKMGAYMEEKLLRIDNADYVRALSCKNEGAPFHAYLAVLLDSIKTKPAKIGELQHEQLAVLNSFALSPERTTELTRTISQLISQNQRNRVNEVYLNFAQISLRSKTAYLLREGTKLVNELVEASSQWAKEDLVFLPQVLGALLNQEAIEENPGLINGQLEITIATVKYEKELKEDTEAWERAISPVFQRIIPLMQ